MSSAPGYQLIISKQFIPNRFFTHRLLRLSAFLLLAFAGYAASASPDRINSPVDGSRTRVLKGNLHHLAQAPNDQGLADPQTPMNDMVFLVKPSVAQQADLQQLLADQQDPSSPLFHQW